MITRREFIISLLALLLTRKLRPARPDPKPAQGWTISGRNNEAGGWTIGGNSCGGRAQGWNISSHV